MTISSLDVRVVKHQSFLDDVIGGSNLLDSIRLECKDDKDAVYPRYCGHMQAQLMSCIDTMRQMQAQIRTLQGEALATDVALKTLDNDERGLFDEKFDEMLNILDEKGLL